MTEYKRLLRSVVQLQCKNEHTKEVDHIFLKTTACISPAFPMLQEMFPFAKFVFNTRNFKPTLESWIKLGKIIDTGLAYYTGAFDKV